MKPYDFEFPTEWSLCPDVKQKESSQPPVVEDKTEDPDHEPNKSLSKPRVFAAGGSSPSW